MPVLAILAIGTLPKPAHKISALSTHAIAGMLEGWITQVSTNNISCYVLAPCIVSLGSECAQPIGIQHICLTAVLDLEEPS